MKFRVTQPFTANQVATRRREKFLPGELIVLIDGSELPSEARFIRLNGLRPSRGAECRYAVESDELKGKTESAGRPLSPADQPRRGNAGDSSVREH
jgi:hypothetical protein